MTPSNNPELLLDGPLARAAYYVTATERILCSIALMAAAELAFRTPAGWWETEGDGDVMQALLEHAPGAPDPLPREVARSVMEFTHKPFRLKQ